MHIVVRTTACIAFFLFLEPGLKSYRFIKSLKSKATIGGILHHKAIFCHRICLKWQATNKCSLVTLKVMKH
ncbi:hypothetical protein Hanom_Chr07g00644491 [Helianthus anomalus]